MSVLEGLFTDPQAIRSARLDEIAKANRARQQMSLLNQVAAGRGSQMAEGIAGMFGLQTPEERKAVELQKLGKNIDMSDPKSLLAFAKQLNDAGHTKQAVVVADRARKIQEEQAAEARRAAQETRAAAQEARTVEDRKHRTRQVRETVNIPVWNSKKTEIIGTKSQQIMVTEYWDEDKKQWVRKGTTATDSSAPATKGRKTVADIYGTTTAAPAEQHDPAEYDEWVSP